MRLFRKTTGPPAAPRWRLRPVDEASAGRLSRSLGVHAAVGRLMAARGWLDEPTCGDFLNPRLSSLRDPFDLADMDRAADRALRAVRNHESIAVFGDYDVDGVSSTAIVLLTLRRLGADPRHFIPHRILDGYGMTAERVEELARSGVKLLITVDTGITAVDAIDRATAMGMEVIVTDHHLAAECLPRAVAVVNPNRPDATYDGARLCGAGVAFKFAHALMKKAGVPPDEARVFLRGLLELVALGTIADVVPLTGENRVFARHGLDLLAKTTRPGLRALFEESGRAHHPVSAETVGFILGPRINAAGRTDHADVALELLLTEDPARARVIARQLEDFNKKRRVEEQEILGHSSTLADDQLASGEDRVLVVGGADYHLGIVGIVAARLAEKYFMPAIVLRLDDRIAKGSARSIPGFDIHEALHACAGHLLGFGGHAAAAGVQLEPAAVPLFRSAINEYAATVLDGEHLTPVVEIDAEVHADEMDWRLYDDVQRLQPFGEANPAPVFMMRGLRTGSAPRIVGTNHLKLALRTGTATMPAIGFNLGHLLPMCDNGQAVDVLFRPSSNTWRGQTSLEFELFDLRPATA